MSRQGKPCTASWISTPPTWTCKRTSPLSHRYASRRRHEEGALGEEATRRVAGAQLGPTRPAAPASEEHAIGARVRRMVPVPRPSPCAPNRTRVSSSPTISRLEPITVTLYCRVPSTRGLDRPGARSPAGRHGPWFRPPPCPPGRASYASRSPGRTCSTRMRRRKPFCCSIHPAYRMDLSARDMARFGLLFLRHGRSEGR